MYQNFIIPYSYEAQHVSGDTPPIIKSLKLHWQPLVFYTWKVVWTCSWWTLSGTYCVQMILCAMLHAALHTVSFVHGCFAGKCILTGSTE
jgi:hypothetical protein